MKWFITLLITAAVCTGCSGGEKPVSPAGGVVILPEHVVVTTSVTTPVGTMHEMVHVPAGPFEMGSTVQSDEQPVHTVELDGYYIDTYEVTNIQYHAYLTTGGGAASKFEEWHENYRNNPRYNGAQQPVVGNWDEAAGYCAWAGLRLPTEAEWEKAARGTDGRIYPWGDEAATCERAVMDEGGAGCGRGEAAWDVGSKPAGVSPYGAHDMAGNVREWTTDWWHPDYYGASPDRNPTGPASGSLAFRVLRGGSWGSRIDDLRASARAYRMPTARGSFDRGLGFRCAQDE